MACKEIRRLHKRGQMFLISSVIIILGIVSLSGLLGVYRTSEEARVQESLILDRQVKNMRNEYEMTAAASRLGIDVNGTAIALLSNFSELLRNTADAEIFYSFVYFNASNNNYSVTVGNYMKEMINVTINVTSSTAAGALIGNVNDMSNATVTFGSGISSGTVSVNVTYLAQGGNTTESIPVSISPRNYAALFYDIKLYEGNDFVRVKDVYNMTW